MAQRPLNGSRFAAHGLHVGGFPLILKAKTKVGPTDILGIQPGNPTMQPKTIVRDALRILVLTFVGGFFIGVNRSLSSNPDQQNDLLIAGSNLVFSTVGFTISAARSPRQRWKHILLVALCVWPMGLINVLFGAPSFNGSLESFSFSSLWHWAERYPTSSHDHHCPLTRTLVPTMA